MVQITTEHVGEYYLNTPDPDPASQFNIHRIKLGRSSLYIALSQAISSTKDTTAIVDNWTGLKVESRDKIHTIESNGEAADLTTAMMAETAFLRMRLDHEAENTDRVLVKTDDPEVYERALGAQLVGEEDGKALLRAKVSGIVGNSRKTLRRHHYNLAPPHYL